MKYVIFVACILLGSCVKKTHCRQAIWITEEAAILGCRVAAEHMDPEQLGGRTPAQWCDAIEDVTSVLNHELLYRQCVELEDN